MDSVCYIVVKSDGTFSLKNTPSSVIKLAAELVDADTLTITRIVRIGTHGPLQEMKLDMNGGRLQLVLK